MSFNLGIGDIAVVTHLAWKLYKNVKESSADFKQLSTELIALYAVVNETHDFLVENGDDLEPWRWDRLEDLIKACQGPLEELEQIYNRYESLSTQAQRTWDRMHFGLRDIAPLRQRLIASTTLLGSFSSIMIMSSTAQMNKKLGKFMTEVQAGMREGSVVSNSDAVSTIDSPDGWDQFRRELEDIGLSEDVLESRRDYIVSWIKNALADGRLEETAVGSEDTIVRAPTPTSDSVQDPSWYHTAYSETDRSSIDNDLTAVQSEVSSLSAASEAFEDEVRRAQNERSIGELLDPVAVSNTYSLQVPDSGRPKARRRRTADAVGLVKKLFQKQTAIIQAASDGDLDRVARLLSLGMPIDARDRWGWTALSMCGYGGHAAIARLLLNHGAKLDNVDVDGDTPRSLAAQRGHTALVVMFDQEEAKRQREAQS